MNRCALVTGASSGVGKAIAEVFAENNIDVGIHYNVNKEGAVNVFKNYVNCRAIYQQNFIEDEIDLVGRFINGFGRIDILVNNAGVISSKSFLDTEEEDYDETFKINSRSAFILARDAFKHMKKQKFGRIVNIGSNAVKFGSGRNDAIHYAASKANLDILTRGLSRLGAEHNILVNSVNPGVIDTRMQKNRKDIEERIEQIPLKRMGTVQDVANLVYYLVSEKNNFITGQVIGVTGGE